MVDGDDAGALHTSPQHVRRPLPPTAAAAAARATPLQPPNAAAKPPQSPHLGPLVDAAEEVLALVPNGHHQRLKPWVERLAAHRRQVDKIEEQARAARRERADRGEQRLEGGRRQVVDEALLGGLGGGLG